MSVLVLMVNYRLTINHFYLSYFFTVNNELKPVRIQFMLPSGIKASEVHIYEEQQKIIIQDGMFEDSLKELGVRIYVVE